MNRYLFSQPKPKPKRVREPKISIDTDYVMRQMEYEMHKREYERRRREMEDLALRYGR